MAYQEDAKLSQAQREPEIHTLIQELHGLIGSQAEAIDMLESRLATVSSPAPPTACSANTIGHPVESPIGNELYGMKVRLQSILEQTRNVRSRLCI
jgi:hypothetical protein